MNNEAFKAMVRDRGQSTKEFARAVVEAEFKKKRKGQKRKHEGYSSDSGDEDDDQKPKKKGQHNMLRPNQVKVPTTKEIKEVTEQYRDRAKERREGGSSDPSSMTADPDLSLPPVQKGLDMKLVREERGKLLQTKDNNSSKGGSGEHELLDPDVLSISGQGQFTMSEVLKEPSTLSPEITRYIMDLLDFSKNNSSKKVVCGLEGRILQRTRLVMNALGHPSDHRRAWEVPREIVNATAQEEFLATPPLSEKMLEEIDRAFPVKQASHEAVTSTALVEPSNNTAICVKETKSGGESDDDDDIFDGLDDYVPPKPP